MELESKIELVVDAYFNHLKTRALQRVKAANLKYKDKWEGLTLDELRMEIEDELVDMLVYSALKEYREATDEDK